MRQTRTWLITGCSTGIGRGIAEAVLQKGENAVVTARDKSRVKDFEERYPGKALAVTLDMEKPETIAQAVEQAQERFGSIDVLINNAGHGYRAALEEGEPAAVAELFQTNFFGPVELIKRVLPPMRERKYGVIVNVSSIGAVVPGLGSGYYGASKAALEAVTDSLRREVAPLGIKAFIVEPGSFRTAFYDDALRGSQVKIGDYDQTSGKTRKENIVNTHQQPGDPRKGGALIAEAVDMDDPPLRVLLGSDAVKFVTAQRKAQLEEAQAQAEFAARSDYWVTAKPYFLPRIKNKEERIMKDFTYSYPTHVYFGKGALANALKAELPVEAKKVLLAYGGGSIKKNGIYQEVTGLLQELGKEVVEFTGIMANPTYQKVQEGAQIAKEKAVDYILAVGGGSVIDCCKIVAAQAKTDKDLWEMEFVDHQFPQAVIPMGAVVTASGTGAEMNGGAVITNEAFTVKAGMGAAAPRFAVLDPSYTLTVPRMQVLSGAFDTLSHAMETYFGNSDSDNVSDDVALAIMKNTVVNMRRLLQNMDDLEARGNLMWDSAMAENGILKVGRLTDFQAHQMEHQLGAYTDCNHGQGLAVIHPAYYRFLCPYAKGKFTRFAQVVFDKETAEEGIDALSAFIQECGLPTKMGQLQSKVEITPDLLCQVADSCNLIQTNPHPLTHEDVYQILQACL